jgi:hypothetical protein
LKQVAVGLGERQWTAVEIALREIEGVSENDRANC